MSHYYSGQRARHYNTRWRTFTKRTLSETWAMIDMEALCQVQASQGRAPRVLDVACGTGVLLRQLAERFPEAELTGIDASTDMLTQARHALKSFPHVHVAQAEVGPGETAGLAYPPNTFDLITCTNVAHDLAQPADVLLGLGRLLTAEGQLIIEDYARREPPFPWWMVEWLARRIEGGHVRAYTFSEAEALCQQANLHVECAKPFIVNWLWHGWVLRVCVGSTFRSAHEHDESDQ